MGGTKAILLERRKHIWAVPRGYRGAVVPSHDDGEAFHMWVTKEPLHFLPLCLTLTLAPLQNF